MIKQPLEKKPRTKPKAPPVQELLTSPATELEVRQAIKNAEGFLERTRCVLE